MQTRGFCWFWLVLVFIAKYKPVSKQRPHGLWSYLGANKIKKTNKRAKIYNNSKIKEKLRGWRKLWNWRGGGT